MGDEKIVDGLYREPADAANGRRARQYEQLEQYIRAARERADERRRFFCRPDLSSVSAFERSAAPYRDAFVRMLGRPLSEYREGEAIPEAEVEFVAEDGISRIYRLEIGVGEGLSLYGVLLLPLGCGEGPCPLAIVQHGGQGTPELCAGFHRESNYNDMPRRILRRGFAVFLPQLHLWSGEYGPERNRQPFDNRLKQLGGSIAAVELYKLRRALDYLAARPDIDGGRIAMAGLSYGGFYTLFAAAVDLRLRAAYTSCFFNNRFVYDWSDWTWFNSGNTFLDAEVAGLVCPRPLYIEVGSDDELFEAKYAVAEYDKVKRLYEGLGLADRLRFKMFQGKHEFDAADDGIDFLCRALAEG